MKTKVYKNGEFILTADIIRLSIEDKNIIEDILQNTNFFTFNRSNYRQMLENPDYFLCAMLDDKGSLLSSTAIELNYNMQYYPLTDEIVNCKNLTKDFFKNSILKTEQVGFIGAGYVPNLIRNKNYSAIIIDYILCNFKSEQYGVGLMSDGVNILYPKKELLSCEIMFEKRGFEKRGFEKRVLLNTYSPLYFVTEASKKTVYQFHEVK